MRWWSPHGQRRSIHCEDATRAGMLCRASRDPERAEVRRATSHRPSRPELYGGRRGPRAERASDRLERRSWHGIEQVQEYIHKTHTRPDAPPATRRAHRVGVRFPEGLKLLHFYTEFPA
jgi:hypothetical protein